MTTPLPQRLAGKFALVTGASRGIGRAVAERFAAEGAVVAIDHAGDAEAAEAAVTAIQARDAREGRGVRDHHAIDADMSDEHAVDALVKGVVARFGRLDILVNNAGIQSEMPSEAFDTAKVEKILAVNLMGAAWACRAAIAHFLSRPGGGTIVNTTSVHEIVPKPGYLAYAMSKAGLGHLTRTLALEFADRGIRVNAVGPGAVKTDMNAGWVGDAKAEAGVASHIPLGYAAVAEQISPTYAFLASDEASYITGQTIFVCGGLTIYGDFKSNWAS